MTKEAWFTLVGGVTLGLLWAVFEFGRHVERVAISAQPPVIDTVMVVDTVTVPGDTIVVTRVRTRIDTLTLPHGVVQFTAQADTVVDGASLSISYLSPVPLSSEGSFSIKIHIPPKLVPVKVPFIIEKTVVLDDSIPWWLLALVSLGSLLVGVLLI